MDNGVAGQWEIEAAFSITGCGLPTSLSRKDGVSEERHWREYSERQLNPTLND